MEHHWKITGLTWFTGWWVVYLPLRKMMEFVSWDDEIPNIWKNKNVPNHQSENDSQINRDVYDV